MNTSNVFKLNYYFERCSIIDSPVWTNGDKEYLKTWGNEHYCPVHGIHIFLLDGQYVATARATNDSIKQAHSSQGAVLEDSFSIRDHLDHEWTIPCPKEKVIYVINFLNSKSLLHYTLHRSDLKAKYINHLIAVAEINKNKQDAIGVLYAKYFRNFEKVNYVLGDDGHCLTVAHDRPNLLQPIFNPNVTAAQRRARYQILNRNYDAELAKIIKNFRLAIEQLRKTEKVL